MSDDRDGRMRVHFDDLAFVEDLSHATEAGRSVALDARRLLSLDGAQVGRLLGCDANGRDGTRLAGCVKLYLPDARGPWRMVFEVTRESSSGRLVLSFLAFGLGHPTKPWQPSAYQVAHQRLHPDE